MNNKQTTSANPFAYIKQVDEMNQINNNEQKNRVEQMEQINKEGLDLFRRKNADYGDAFANYGSIGVLVRIGDKIQRMHHISKNKIVLVDDESLRDTLIDLHNYSAMAIMLLDEHKQ
jgi:hypothetical protein